MEHVFASAAVALVIVVCGLLLWLRKFQVAGSQLQESRRKEKQADREEYLSDLEHRMEAAEDKYRKKKKVTSVIFLERFYVQRLKGDDRDSIREVLRRRKNKLKAR